MFSIQQKQHWNPQLSIIKHTIGNYTFFTEFLSVAHSYQLLVIRCKIICIAIRKQQHLRVAVYSEHSLHIPMCQDKVHNSTNFRLRMRIWSMVRLITRIAARSGTCNKTRLLFLTLFLFFIYRVAVQGNALAFAIKCWTCRCLDLNSPTFFYFHRQKR